MECEGCGNETFTELGTLGSLTHYRCRACGLDAAVEEEEELDDDRFADGDALASAGFGTDEDYGGIGGTDWGVD